MSRSKAVFELVVDGMNVPSTFVTLLIRLAGLKLFPWIVRDTGEVVWITGEGVTDDSECVSLKDVYATFPEISPVAVT